MTPLYESLAEYIKTRSRQSGYKSLATFSEDLGFGRSYLNSVVNDQFQPSFDRCWKIANFLGDNPAIILGLAGYATPGYDHIPEIEFLSAVASSLPKHRLHMLITFARFLKTQPIASMTDERVLEEDPSDHFHLYVMLPDGNELELDVPKGIVDIPSAELKESCEVYLEDLINGRNL